MVLGNDEELPAERADARRDHGARDRPSRSTRPTLASLRSRAPYPVRMTIRTLLALLPLAACLDTAPLAPDAATAPRSNLICSPLCDGGYQSTLQDAFGYGFGLFPGARSTAASCADIGIGAPRWDCVVTFISEQNPCGTYTAECVERGPGQAPRCRWLNPYNCP